MKPSRPLTIETLYRLDSIPFEQWRDHGVKLKAVSANAHGTVNSGILADGRHFYRKWDYDMHTGVHSNPRFVFST